RDRASASRFFAALRMTELVLLGALNLTRPGDEPRREGGRPMAEQMTLTRNLGMELVRATEAAALAAARLMGRGDKNAADGAAVKAMRAYLADVDMDGIVVIGEGEKDAAPMLYIGEHIGNGRPPHVDIAVDPIDGTRLLSQGMPGAVAVVALAARGTMYGAPPGVYYMEKIAVGYRAKDAVNIRA